MLAFTVAAGMSRMRRVRAASSGAGCSAAVPASRVLLPTGLEHGDDHGDEVDHELGLLIELPEPGEPDVVIVAEHDRTMRIIKGRYWNSATTVCRTAASSASLVSATAFRDHAPRPSPGLRPPRP